MSPILMELPKVKTPKQEDNLLKRLIREKLLVIFSCLISTQGWKTNWLTRTSKQTNEQKYLKNAKYVGPQQRAHLSLCSERFSPNDLCYLTKDEYITSHLKIKEIKKFCYKNPLFYF